MMIDIDVINQILKEQFGAQDNLANFRIARTEDQFEYRKWADGVIRYGKKYNYLIGRYWVIERLFHVSGANEDILPGLKYSYEPIFIFKKPKVNEELPINEEIVHCIIRMCLFKQESKIKRDWNQEELDYYEKQVERALEFIQDECSPMSMQLHFGEAVVKGERKVQ